MRLAIKILAAVAALAVLPVLAVAAWPSVRPLLLFHFFGFVGLWAAAALGLAICLVTVLTDRAQAKTESRPARGQKWIAPLVAAFLGIPVIFGAAIALSRALPHALPSGSHARTFEPAAWASPAAADFTPSDPGRASIRQAMLGDLVEHVLPGKTKAEIEALLGPSSSEGYFRSSGAALIYQTGPQRDSLFRVDSEWLLVFVDGNGRFSRFELKSD